MKTNHNSMAQALKSENIDFMRTRDQSPKFQTAETKFGDGSNPFRSNNNSNLNLQSNMTTAGR